MKKTLFYVAVLSVLAALLLAACGGGATSAPESGPDSAPASAGDAQPESPSGEGGGQEEAPAPPENEIPEDVPVMENAYEIRVSSTRNGFDMTYRVDTDIETALAYYQEALLEAGWQETTSRDSIVGSLASMARINEAEDSLTVSMTYNAGGGFVEIRVSVSRTTVE